MTKIQIDATSSETNHPFIDNETVVAPASKTLPEIFSDDIQNRSKQSVKAEETISNATFWQRIYEWWTNYGLGSTTTTSSSATDHLPPPSRMEPISSVPTLEKPSISLPQLPPEQSKSSARELLSDSHMMEGLSQMSSFTLETIMLILYKAQLEIDKECAKNIENSFERFQQFKKIQQQTLIEIKDALAKDEKVSKFFQTAHNWTLAANFIVGAACAATSIGFLTALPLFLCIATALSGASKTFFDYRTNQSRAKFEELNHQEQYSSDAYADVRRRIQEVMEGDGVFKEKFAEFLRRLNKIRKYVITPTE